MRHPWRARFPSFAQVYFITSVLVILFLLNSRRPLAPRKPLPWELLYPQDANWAFTTPPPTTNAATPTKRRKALILASYKDQNVEWQRNVPKDWEMYRYMMDDPYAPLTVIRNQGREAQAYITFILDHYHDLPDYIVFVHGHKRSWHQLEPVDHKLRTINLTALDEEGWLPLRCENNPSCIPETYLNTTWAPPGHHPAAYLMPGFFRFIFPEWTGVEMPMTFAAACCGQFAVSKAAVLGRPMEFWKHLHMPLTRDLEDFKWGSNLDEWVMGLLFEKTWHYLFGKPAMWCPPEDYCRRIYFQNASHCERYIGDAPHAAGWETVKCWLDEGF